MAEYTNKWTTTIQFPTCLIQLIKGVVSLVRWKTKWECRYHETVTHSFSFSYDFHPSNKVSIFIAILGVSASASPPSPSGLALVLINKKNCNVENKVRASAFGFIEVHVYFMKTYRCRCEREHYQGICASNHPYVITFHNSIAQISSIYDQIRLTILRKINFTQSLIYNCYWTNQIDFGSFDEGGKPQCPGKNLSKHSWGTKTQLTYTWSALTTRSTPSPTGTMRKGKVSNDYKRMKTETTASGETIASACKSGW